MSNNIKQVLRQIGKAPEEIHLPDHSRVLLLPYGGRVLGLYCGDSDQNFLWTNPALESVESALAFYERDAWPNSGGDRTWLAPEGELFIADSKRPWETYRVPPALDPGQYVCKKEHGQVTLSNRLIVNQLQSGRSAEVRISKSVAPAANPLRREADLCRDVRYAGYTLQVSLEFVSDAPASVSVGPWNLLQLPHAGELFVGTYGRTEPIVQLGKVPPADVAATEGLLRYRMSAEGIQKIGVHAAAVTGRAAYLHELDRDEVALVVRNFSVNPSGNYIDAPWDRLSDEGYCFQACNVSDPAFGRFSEVEHHVPAIGLGTDRDSCADVSQVWAFRGERKAILRILSRLMGAVLER